VVILALSADWIAGSLISGEKFATYRSVLETWLAVQTPMTAMGASAQPKMMSSRATGTRQLSRRLLAAPWEPPPESPLARSWLTSARSRCSSECSSSPTFSWP